MATYVSTMRYTQQGIKAVGETTKRAASMRSAAKKMGVKISDVYWTMGAYDGVLIMEAADDETVTAFLLKLSSLGNIQTTTARAFSAAEMDKVLAKMGG